jgi:hypothetical protein
VIVISENTTWSQTSQDAMISLLKIRTHKITKMKIVSLHKDVCYNQYNFQNQIQNTNGKKTNWYVNSIICVCIFVTQLMFDWYFFVLYVYFKFGSKNSRECIHTSGVTPQIQSISYVFYHNPRIIVVIHTT